MLKEQHHYCCVDWGKISWSFVLVLVQSNQPEIRLLIWLEAADSSTDKAKQSLKDSKRRKLRQVDFQMPLHCRLGTSFLFCLCCHQAVGGILQVSSPMLEKISNPKHILVTCAQHCSGSPDTTEICNRRLLSIIPVRIFILLFSHYLLKTLCFFVIS